MFDASNEVRPSIEDESTREELIAEGEQIEQMIKYSSVVPERANLPYYLICMSWYTRWQKYTGCFVVDFDDEDGEPSDLHKKDKSKVVLGGHPGIINDERDVLKVMRQDLSKLLVP